MKINIHAKINKTHIINRIIWYVVDNVTSNAINRNTVHVASVRTGKINKGRK
jgi:hypothetical protein